MEESLNIAEVEKKFKDKREWLLFEVLETDEVNRPIKGRLLCHSKSREEIHKVIMEKRTAHSHFCLKFTGDPVPPDMVVVL